MEAARIESLEQTLQDNPDNAFARYALALELVNSTHPEEAWPHFEHLLARNPEYAATYFQAGMYLAKLGRSADAREIFKKGIEVTGPQGDQHAQRELMAALDDLTEGV